MDLRKQLLGFARSGSQIAPRRVLEDEEQDDNEDSAMVLDDLGSDAEHEPEDETGELSVLDDLDKNKAAAHQRGLPPDTEITMTASPVTPISKEISTYIVWNICNYKDIHTGG